MQNLEYIITPEVVDASGLVTTYNLNNILEEKCGSGITLGSNGKLNVNYGTGLSLSGTNQLCSSLGNNYKSFNYKATWSTTTVANQATYIFNSNPVMYNNGTQVSITPVTTNVNDYLVFVGGVKYDSNDFTLSINQQTNKLSITFATGSIPTAPGYPIEVNGFLTEISFLDIEVCKEASDNIYNYESKSEYWAVYPKTSFTGTVYQCSTPSSTLTKEITIDNFSYSGAVPNVIVQFTNGFDVVYGSEYKLKINSLNAVDISNFIIHNVASTDLIEFQYVLYEGSYVWRFIKKYIDGGVNSTGSSKYWAEQSSSSASSASTSATTAESWAIGVSNASGSSKYWAEQSQYWATDITTNIPTQGTSIGGSAKYWAQQASSVLDTTRQELNAEYIATAIKFGIVQPDNTTISVNNGVISVIRNNNVNGKTTWKTTTTSNSVSYTFNGDTPVFPSFDENEYICTLGTTVLSPSSFSLISPRTIELINYSSNTYPEVGLELCLHHFTGSENGNGYTRHQTHNIVLSNADTASYNIYLDQTDCVSYYYLAYNSTNVNTILMGNKNIPITVSKSANLLSDIAYEFTFVVNNTANATDLKVTLFGTEYSVSNGKNVYKMLSLDSGTSWLRNV